MKNPLESDDAPTMRLAYQPPLAWTALTRFLATRGAHNIEQCVHGHYQRTIECDTKRGWISVAPDTRAAALEVTAAPALADVMPQLQHKLRVLFDLDADPALIANCLQRDEQLALRLEQTPGLRIPGTVDGFELALRAILGQQITVKAATTLFTRFADYFGASIKTPFEGLNRLAPNAVAIANASLQQIIDRGLPSRRAQTVQTLAQAIAAGELRLDRQAPVAQTRAELQALPGIGPWTAHYISMRALGDADAFPNHDLGLLRALQIDKPQQLKTMAQAWRPWRAYAAMYIWHHHGAGG